METKEKNKENAPQETKPIYQPISFNTINIPFYAEHQW